MANKKVEIHAEICHCIMELIEMEVDENESK